MNDLSLVERVDAVLPVLAEHARAIDDSAAFPEVGLSVLRESGLLGLLVPEEFGGLGGTLADLVTISGRLAGKCLSTALIWAMHCQQVDALVRFGSTDLKVDVLPRVAKGQLYLASVTTGPVHGGSLLASASPLVHGDDGLDLQREAPIVTGGLHADAFLVTMKADPDASAAQVTLVYAERDQVDVTTTREWHALGMRGTQSVGVRMSGHLPAVNVVGPPGGFRTVALESYAVAAHLGWAACWLGAARQALADFVGVLRSATRPRAAGSDLFAERLARIRIALELPHAYLSVVTAEVTQHRDAGRSLDTPAIQTHLNTLKVAAAEHAYAAVNALIDVAGLDLGYRQDSAIPLERCLRDLRSASLNFANDRLLVAIGALVPLDRRVHLAGTP